MSILLWQCNGMDKIVLWDGKNTYWCDEMYASDGYKHIPMDKVDDGSVFTFIGML